MDAYFLGLGGFDGPWYYPVFAVRGFHFLSTLSQVYKYLDFPLVDSHFDDWQILDDLAAHDQFDYYIPHCTDI